jgi:hypothetical protein
MTVLRVIDDALDTPGTMPRLREVETQDDPRLSSEEVVALIPEILATAERFDARAKEQVAYIDLLSQVDDVLGAVLYFASAEFEALAPSLISGARQFEGSGSHGFVAMGRLIQLQLLAEHPEVIQQAVKQAERELHTALHHGSLPKRFSPED